MRALAITAAAWIFATSMVAWGPVHNNNVYLDSAGFWIPWTVLAVPSVGVVFGCAAVRTRRDQRLAI